MPSFTAGGPQARSGLSAGSLHTRREKASKSRGGSARREAPPETRGGSSGPQLQGFRFCSSVSYGCLSGPGRHTARNGVARTVLASPSDEAALCTEEL
jgi:hypothetical protein